MRIRIGRRTAQVAAVGALTLGVMGLTTGGAWAAGPGGAEQCPGGNVCLYYNSPGNGWGAWEDWSPGASHLGLGMYYFGHWGNGSGWNVNVWGNAASIVNNTNHYVSVDEINGGTVYFPPGYAGTLGVAWNNDGWLTT
jgi:hypothetical protein